MIKAIIFDCFGVLLGDAYKLRLMKFEQDHPKEAEEIRAVNHASDMGILTHDETRQRVSELFGIDPEDFAEEQDQAEVPNIDLLDYIATLKDTYKIGMLSNVSSRQRLGYRFAEGQLDAHFDTIIASGDEGFVKPQPELFQIAATRLGVQPHECVMIDDIAGHCEGARAVGMHAIQFLNNQQCITDLNSLIDRGEKRD